jgi:hypothetical protein
MQKTNRFFARSVCAILATVVFSLNQPAFAGWTGLINGLGVGWASVNVRSSTLRTNKVTTVNLTYPSAAMAPTTGYKTNAPLPSGASTNTYSRIKGLAGGVWQAASKAAIGDGTDNAELQSRVKIVPSDCAFLTFDSQIDQSQSNFNANGNSGTITVNATATAGTALWLRGFEYSGSMENVPVDNPDTSENESIEYLKTNAVVRFETLILGPFQFGGTNCPLIIPFSLNSSNLESLVFASDAAVLSLPLVVVCPSDIVVKCDESFSYPPVQYAGCGNIALTYSPARPADGIFPAGSFPVGVTPVTVTATDTDGHSTSCTFNVTVTDTVPPVAPVLPTLAGTCSTPVSLTAPTTTDNCAGTVTGTTTNATLYGLPGNYTVYWTFNDGHGNRTTTTQTVIITGLEFHGFYPPISGTGGSCSAPLRTATLGNNLPVKFDVSCGGISYEVGRPTLSIERAAQPSQPCGPLTLIGGGDFVLVAHEWHFNWDTTGQQKGNYKLTATLQDGTKQSVWIKVK